MYKSIVKSGGGYAHDNDKVLDDLAKQLPEIYNKQKLDLTDAQEKLLNKIAPFILYNAQEIKKGVLHNFVSKQAQIYSEQSKFQLRVEDFMSDTSAKVISVASFTSLMGIAGLFITKNLSTQNINQPLKIISSAIGVLFCCSAYMNLKHNKAKSDIKSRFHNMII